MTTDHLAELGSEFATLRAESAKLRERQREIRERLAALRPAIQEQVVKDARSGRRQAEIVRATGYSRENIRQICREAGIDPAE